MTPARKHVVLAGGYAVTTTAFLASGFALAIAYAISLVVLTVVGVKWP